MQYSHREDGSTKEAPSKAAPRAAPGRGHATRARLETFVRAEPKVGRNEPCPCGSGKKFKQCHGKAL